MHILMLGRHPRGSLPEHLDGGASATDRDARGDSRSRSAPAGPGGALDAIQVPLRGLAQLVFAERADAGLLVLAAIWLVAPWSALGAVLGAAFGSAAGYVLPTYTRAEWKLGLAGFNGAIVGILWGGFLASGAPQPLLFTAVLCLCLILEAALKAVLRPVALPPLSMPAVATAMLVSFALAPTGTWFWISAGEPPLATTGVHIAVICVVLAAASKHQTATLQAMILSAAAVWLAADALGLSPLHSAGLWAFAVAPASFAAQALLVPGVMAGAAAGLLAAGFATAIWFAWYLSGLMGVAQPLLAPFVLGTWISVWALRRHGRTAWLEPAFWRACVALARARLARRGVVALTGGKFGEALGVPDYPSGSWRDPELPASAYSLRRFATSQRCRRIGWEACQALRERVQAVRPSPAHRHLAEMARQGLVDATLTTSVDGLHGGDAGRETVELFGRLTTVTCLECGADQDWPPARVWQRWDLHCPACGGLLRPGVTFPGDELSEAVWKRAKTLATGCGVLLVIGLPHRTPTDEALIDLARRRGACVVFMNQGPIAHTLRPDDLVIIAPIACVLRAFTRALTVFTALARPGKEKSPASHTS
jgi:NAD-dependent deacetylase